VPRCEGTIFSLRLYDLRLRISLVPSRHTAEIGVAASAIMLAQALGAAVIELKLLWVFNAVTALCFRAISERRSHICVMLKLTQRLL
jgi:hypothetical protein